MKYDCSRTMDYVHENARLCTVYTNCEGCPLGDTVNCAFVGDITPEHINVLQKWSDEHPEKPKLTREEYDFLASFMYPEELFIRKGGFTMQLDTAYAAGYSNATIPLRKDMFPFIQDGEEWRVDKLLGLEVEETANILPAEDKN